MKIFTRIKISAVGLFLFLATSSNVMGQVVGAKYDKLVDLYVTDRIEDCLVKAAKMSESDKYKGDSEVYLWIALCYYDILNNQELLEFYPKAAKDAIKYGGKFKKKDDKQKSKELDYLFDDNMEFMYKLIALGLVEGKSYMAMDNYTKALWYYKATAALDPENVDCDFLYGVAMMYNRNTKEGQVKIDAAMEFYKQKAAEGGYVFDEDSYQAYEDAVVYYVKYLEDAGKTQEAFQVVALAVKLVPNNPKFVSLYKKLG